MHISLSAEKLFELWGLPVTNTLLTSWIVIILLAILAYFGTRKIKTVPRGIQNLLELIIEGLFNFFNSVWQDRKKTKKYFPLLATLFIFIIILIGLGFCRG